MKFPSPIGAVLMSVLLLWMAGCQSMAYGMKPAVKPGSAAMANSAKGDFDTTLGADADDDKIGTWIFVGIATAAAVAASILVPLYVTDKL